MIYMAIFNLICSLLPFITQHIMENAFSAARDFYVALWQHKNLGGIIDYEYIHVFSLAAFPP